MISSVLVLMTSVVFLPADIDECLLQALRGLQFCQSSEVCANEDGGYTCVCPPGQYRVPSDGSSFRVCAGE